MEYCDLHCHSNCSDGSMPPEQVIDEACRAGLSAIALTDHNSMNGLARAAAAAEGRILFCNGCEITTQESGTELHLLGLVLDLDRTEALKKALDSQIRRKEESNRVTIENLAKAGYDVSYEEFLEKNPDQVRNRVAIANYLIAKGVKGETKQVIRTLLSVKEGFYQPPERLDFYEMIPLIRSAGGVAVWAHPLFHVDRAACDTILRKAKDCGLDGAEVYYSTYDEDDTCFMQEMCRKYKLLESGGSDFHGTNKPDIRIATGKGNLRVPFSCYEALRKLAAERQQR